MEKSSNALDKARQLDALRQADPKWICQGKIYQEILFDFFQTKDWIRGPLLHCTKSALVFS